MNRFHHSSSIRRRPHRRASIYLPVLFVGSVIVVMSLGGMMIARSHGRIAQLRSSSAEARSLARSSIELARALITADDDWRYNRMNGAWITNVPMGRGTVSVSVTNPSGDLDRSPLDPVTVVGTGTSGTASQTLTASLDVDTVTAYDSLGCSMAAKGNITFASGSVSAPATIIASNANITAASTTVTANTQASGSVSGSSYAGTTSSGTPARTFPLINNVFTYYQTYGSTITYSSLPAGSPGRKITQVLLSPASNPYGSTNSSGIYILDCGGNDLTIDTCRIVGTLYVLNASSVTIGNQVNWAPAINNYPCLIVAGSLAFNASSNALNESSGHNYNPSGTPYPYSGGTTDANTTTSYPAGITGLVYASGSVSIKQTLNIHTLLAGGSIASTSATINVAYDARYTTAPPPGFGKVKFKIRDNSFK